MTGIISHCPVCSHKMTATKLTCPECTTELSNTFELNKYSFLNSYELEFLECFLSSEGNMNAVQKKMSLSYPIAKKLLTQVLNALNLSSKNTIKEELMDVSNIKKIEDSKKASDIIRNLLVANGGWAMVTSQSGRSEYKIILNANGSSFYCKALPPVYTFSLSVFDIIIDLLKEQGGRARKGNGRNYRLGEGDCTYDTVAGRVGRDFFKVKEGKYTPDPVMVLTAVLLWADICSPVIGHLELSASYRTLIAE